MSKKADIRSLISRLKKQAKNKGVSQSQPSMSEALTKAFVHPEFRERDMRQEAKDIGAHGAEEYFK